MKFTKNQLAMAAYVCVNGDDGEIDKTEANTLRDAFAASNDFNASIEDWKFILSLFSSGKLDWDEVANNLKNYQLLVRYKICRLICIGVNASGNDWNAFNKFIIDIDVDLASYNSWIETGGKS
jgi:hypothetical protein